MKELARGSYQPRSVPTQKLRAARVTIVVDTNTSWSLEPLDRGATESLDDYADRVRAKIIEMHRRFESSSR